MNNPKSAKEMAQDILKMRTRGYDEIMARLVLERQLKQMDSKRKQMRVAS